MALTEAEKQQVEAAVDAFLESPNVQTTFTNLVTTAEGGAEKAIDTIIANAKAGGLAVSVVMSWIRGTLKEMLRMA